MSDAFERALRFTLRWEGGYADLDGDPGGPTNLGITQSTYNRYRKMVGAARRLAEGLNTPELANLKLYSRDTQEDILNRMKSGASEEEMKSGAELGYWTGRLKDEFMLLTSRILLPGIKIFTKLFDAITKVTEFISNFFGTLIEKIFGNKDGKKDPVKDNTDALEENTRAINEMRETMGGGRRAQAAIPGRLNGFNLDDAAVRLGLAGGMVV